jgi:hypothetical protein
MAKARFAARAAIDGNGRSGSARGRSARPVAVDGVGDKYSDTDDAEERGNCIQHGNDP